VNNTWLAHAMHVWGGMLQTPAHSEEVRAVLAGLDDELIDRITGTGASIDEIGEAISLLESPATPSTGQVAEVCTILRAASR
jgi:hypothetical protein